jgi:hypothetical protein
VPEVGRHESRTYGEEIKIMANDNWLPDEKHGRKNELRERAIHAIRDLPSVVIGALVAALMSL